MDGEWKPIETAPRDGRWILARSEPGDEIAFVPTDEAGWWEDETGDYYVEARFNRGHGLTEWRPTPEGFEPELF